jgi:hypothetical protein
MLPPLLHPSPHSAPCLSLPYGSSSRIRLAKTLPSLAMRRRRGFWRSRPRSAVPATTSEESVATVSTDDDKVRLGLGSFSEGICCGPVVWLLVCFLVWELPQCVRHSKFLLIICYSALVC